ncbi:serine/threonine phosphatase [Leptothermofonsia sp. ETS-13]|uniref:serine/threonine phosphatase n=1 Tax=Leptothermofonsia sp. ETS-13 TaxID=3035696 RepID=UPI003BA3B658
MLVCPNCQFENPNTNKFCQECGASLTQNTCPECDSLVPFDSVSCQECGAIAGVIWSAIVTGSLQESGNSALAGATSAGSSMGLDSYLDMHGRYRILESFASGNEGASEKWLKVVDCQPFQLSMLEALTKQEFEAAAIESSISSLSQAGEANNSVAELKPLTPSVKSITLPEIAQPYLALQDKYCQALPALHDAWQQNGQQILLLEDRSQFPLLTDLWLDEELAIPQLQLLHWLYEMVELWPVLETVHCQQSLLEVSNLRVDEDQAISLQRLYSDSVSSPPTLQQLGKFWHMLFSQSQRTQLGAISLMLADLEAGNLTTVADLRSRIEAIAHDLQAPPDSTMMPDSDPSDLTDPSELLTTAPSSEVKANPAADISTSVSSTRLEISLDELTDPREDESESESDDLPTVVLPMRLFSLEDAGRTDIGRQRDHNEDYFGIETQASRLESPSGKTVHARNLYILCDGMGGHAGGEVASALAVDTLRRFFQEKWQSSPFSPDSPGKLPSPDVLNEAVQLANKAIFDVNQQSARSGSGRMGTTLVMVLIQDTEAAVVHVGDSRLYRYTRKRGLEQLTVDHEVGQREIQRGVDPEIAYARPDAYQLTQALGPRDEHFIKPDVQYFELNEDSLLLLCSDGLSDNDLLEKHCKSHLEPLLSSQTNLDQGLGQLIELANQYNGHDNITAIAIRAKVRPNLDHLR